MNEQAKAALTGGSNLTTADAEVKDFSTTGTEEIGSTDTLPSHPVTPGSSMELLIRLANDPHTETVDLDPPPLPPLEKINDAVLFGDWDDEEFQAMLDRPVQMAFSKHGEDTKTGTWKTWPKDMPKRDGTLQEGTVRGWCKNLSEHWEGEKAGLAWCQGTVVNGERKAQAVDKLYWMVLDVDVGQKIEEVRAEIMRRKLFAIVHSSHSHMKPVSAVKKDEVVKHSGHDDPTAADVVNYLQGEKRYQAWVLEGATIEKTAHTEDGVMIFLRHQPMPKFRVCFLLDQPFVIAERQGTQKAALQEWKERYAGLANEMNICHDRSTCDCSRLFYAPRHAPGAEFLIEMIAGAPLDLGAVPRPSERRQRASAYDNPLTQTALARGAKGDRKDYMTQGLREFAARFATVFEVADTLVEMGYEEREDKGAIRIVECSNEGNHTESGGTGFHAINASQADVETFQMGCKHDACAGMDRLDLLDLACHQAGITHARELLERYPECFAWTDEVPETKWDEPQQEVKDEAGAVIEPDTRDGDERPVPRTIEEGGALFRNLPAITAPTYRAAKDAAFRALARSDFGPSDVAPIAKAYAKKLILEIHEFKAEVNRLRKEMKKEKAGKKRTLAEPEEALFAPLDRHFSILTHSGSVRIMRYPDPGKADISLLRESEFRLAYRHLGYMYGERVSPQGDPVQEQVVDVWFAREKTVRFPGGIVIDPSRTPQESAADGEYNLFAGWDVQPREGGSCQMFLDHLLENVCRGNREYYEWVVMWMAHMLQFPADKQGSAIVLKGKRGIGKTKVGETLCRLIGRRNSITLADRQHLVGRFGAHKMGRVFILVEEAYHPGDKEGEGVIKHLITSHTMPLEKKGVDTIEIDNFAHLMFTSNEDWTVPAGMGDERRFMVLMVGEGRRNDTDFFKAMDHQMMKEGGDEALMHFLLNYVPPKGKRWEDLRNPPVTEWLLGEGEASMSQLHRFFRDMMRERGCAPVRLYTDNGVTKWLHGFHLPGEGMDAIWEAAQAEQPLFVLPEGPAAETQDGEPVVRDGKIIGRRFMLPWGLLRPHLEHRWKGSGAIPSDRMIRAAAEEWLAADPARKDGEGGGSTHRLNDKQMGLDQPVQRCLSVPLFDDIVRHVKHTKGMTIEPTWDYDVPEGGCIV